MDYHKLMQMRNDANAFASRSGIRTEKIDAGYAETVIEDCQSITNPLGSVHGGALYTLADVAAGSAAATHGRWPVTLNGSMDYLRAGHSPKALRAKAKEVKCGKTIAVYHAEVWQDDKILLATGTFTMYLLDKEIEM
ncbi:MAG: PaaI family thioesterase [Lachnospiraceae bacterium]|nr:PaaI family thioesterase [Lachnospiraceae bacterium]